MGPRRDRTSRDSLNGPSRRVALVALAAVALPGVRLAAQSITVSRAGDAVTVGAGGGLGFIKGEPLAQLKDGRTVRIDLDLSVLPGPGGDAVAGTRQTFVLSYDLWEEQFAVTRAGSPPRGISHLTAAGAEAWCLEQLTVPVSALGALAHAPFWIRLDYRVLDGDPPDDAGSDGFTLRGLIEALSRRRKNHAWTHSIEAGPFRLPS